MPEHSICVPEIEERRSCSRFSCDPELDVAVVWRQVGKEQLVSVHDESLHGICLVMPDCQGFLPGAHATIIFHSEVLDAVVRRVAEYGNGSYLVGFECHAVRSEH